LTALVQKEISAILTTDLEITKNKKGQPKLPHLGA
jgi:hypothetical protein